MKVKSLCYGLACCSFAIPLTGFAQDEEQSAAADLEEIVVTGTFIKKDKFDMASPIETINPEAILTSGQTTIGGLVRSLPYTQNVDTVANVLGVQDGQQDSNSARFNLRGLGTSSTLTLMDGRRAIDPGAIATILPELAISNIDIVLDGGAATYGTDAIAGVVNFVPLQEYDGFKIHAFYTVDAEGDSPEPKLSLLWGNDTDKFDIVAALDYSKRDDPLYRSDRPKYLRADNDTSVFSNPGSYATYSSANNGNGVGIPSPGFRDPDCGNFNGTNTDDGLAGSYPSGSPVSIFCTWEYGEFQDFKRPNENLVTYLSATYDVSDNFSLKAMLNYSDRKSILTQSPTTGEAGSNNLLQIPLTHPNMPASIAATAAAFPFPVTAISPWSTFWRPFTGKMGSTQPSFLDSHGSYTPEFSYKTWQVSLGTEFDLGDSGWSGELWAVSGNVTSSVEGHALNIDKLQLALMGMGGVNGNQWFNPFGSASRLSPNFVAGEAGMGGTENDQGLVDWMFDYGSQDWQEEDYWSVEGFVTGDIFELPAGPVAMAVGAQARNRSLLNRPISVISTRPSTLPQFSNVSSTGGPAGQDYNVAPTNGIGAKTDGESGVNSLFTEFEVPLLDSVSMTLAARYEDFTDFDMKTTVPKISFRWEPFRDLAIRASWGKGFLAPSIREITVRSVPSCAELFSGTDPFGMTLIGTLVCPNGNPNLDPETSKVKNVGFTWLATDDIEVSLDYQRINYDDRIVALSSTDVLANDYANFLAAGLNPASAADRATWYATGQDPAITRDPLTESATRVVTYSDNVNQMQIDVVDFRFRYSVDMGNWGYLSTNLNTTYYPSYKYLDVSTGDFIDAAGKQNGDTGLAPPIPEYKSTLRVGWLLNGHAVAMTVNNQSSVAFDATPGPTFGQDPVTAADIPSRISSYTTIDMRYGYTFENVWGGSFDIGAGATNITNNTAQPLPISGGLETRLQDPIGRTYYIEGTYTFE